MRSVSRTGRNTKETTNFENFCSDNPKEIANSDDNGYSNMIRAWKNEERFYDYRLTKVLNEIKTTVYEQARTCLRVNDFSVDSADETAEEQDEADLYALSPVPLCEYVTKPAASAYIRQVTTHFREIADPNLRINFGDTQNDYAKHVGVSVVGFIFKYSDGVEIELGNLWGSTSSATVSLLEDEHITHVAQTLWNETSLAFRPSSSIGIRKVFFQITNHQGVDRVVYFEDRQVVETRWHGGNDSLMIEGNGILRSLEWSREELKISGVTTQRRPVRASRTNSIDNVASCAVPSLQKLAKRALPQPSEYVQELKDHRFNMVRKCVNQIIISAQGKLLKKFLERHCRIDSLDELNFSLEATREEEVQRDVGREKKALLRMHEDEYIELSCIKSDILSRARGEVNLLGAKGNLLRIQEIEGDGVYEKYKAQLELLQALSNADERLVLCKNVHCLRTFIPSYVRSRKRCNIKGCFEVVPNCGCTTQSCKRCHISFCQRHTKSHEKVCLEAFNSKCGYRDNSTALKPELCGRVFDGTLGRCAACSTTCCYKCSVPCKGHESQITIKLVEGCTLGSIRSQLMSVPCTSVWCIACKTHSDSSNSCCEECISRTAVSPTLTSHLKSNQMMPLNRTT